MLNPSYGYYQEGFGFSRSQIVTLFDLRGITLAVNGANMHRGQRIVTSEEVP
jgi:hypothetical protein